MLFARTAVLLRRSASRVTVGVSSYNIFLRQSKGLLRGLPIRQRAKLLAKQYRALPKAEIAQLKAIAAKTKSVPRKRKGRAGHPWAKFVKANYASVKRLPVQQRLVALAKKFKAAKEAKRK